MRLLLLLVLLVSACGGGAEPNRTDLLELVGDSAEGVRVSVVASSSPGSHVSLSMLARVVASQPDTIPMQARLEFVDDAGTDISAVLAAYRSQQPGWGDLELASVAPQRSVMARGTVVVSFGSTVQLSGLGLSIR